MEYGEINKFFLRNMLDILLKNKENNFRISEQADKIIVWLVGFSFACIALIITKTDLELINKFIPSLAIYFSISTIILGVLYRIINYIVQIFSNSNLLKFQGFVIGKTESPKVNLNRKILDTDSYNEIIDFLKEDFDLDTEKIDLSNYDKDTITKFRSISIDYYNSIRNYHKELMSFELDEIKKILSTYSGISIKKLEKTLNGSHKNTQAKILRCLSLISALLFILTNLSFVAGLIVFLLNFGNVW